LSLHCLTGINTIRSMVLQATLSLPYIPYHYLTSPFLISTLCCVGGTPQAESAIRKSI